MLVYSKSCHAAGLKGEGAIGIRSNCPLRLLNHDLFPRAAEAFSAAR
jgi:hypothetical protein